MYDGIVDACFSVKKGKQTNMNINELLELVKEIQKNIEEEQQKTAAGFNVFELVGIETKEVAMCRVLYGFLCPDGMHKRKTLFLKNFMEEVLELEIEEDELATAVVRKEQLIDEQRRIDLAIETKNRFIPIEVKIYAKDQYHQCLDYYTFACNKNKAKECQKEWHIYYLTLTGYKPSKSSIGDNKECDENLRLISWEKSIYQWIVKLLDETEIKRLPNIYEVLSQFGDSVLKICGKSEQKVCREVADMLKNNVENMKAAKVVVESYQTASTDFLRHFFKKLKNAIKEKLENIEDLKLKEISFFDLDKQIDEYYSTKRSTYPGLTYKIADLSDDYVLAVRVEVDWRLFMGIVVAKKIVDPFGNTTYTSYKTMPQKMKDKAKERITLKENEENPVGWWLTWKYMPDGIDDSEMTVAPDFKQMNEAYYDLYDDNKCKSVIESICSQIEKYNDIIV